MVSELGLNELIADALRAFPMADEHCSWKDKAKRSAY